MILCLPFLMFQGNAQEAIDLYLDTFPDAELLEMIHHPEGTEIHDPANPQPNSAVEGGRLPFANSDDTAAMETVVNVKNTLVATAQLKIGGQILMVQDSLVKQDFDFTPSTSIAVVVDTEEEFTAIVDKLAEGGRFLMEPDSYDFATNFTWVQDRFGMSWQVNQPSHLTDTDSSQHSADNVSQAQAPDWS